MTLARRRAEEVAVVGGLLEHGSGELGSDLVGTLGDAGADSGHDALAQGAHPLHGLDRGLQHAVERAAPAGMRRADHAGLGVGQQHRRAVRGEHAERQPGLAGHQRVDPWRLIRRPGPVGHGNTVGMDLVGGDQAVGRKVDTSHGAGPVLRHLVPLVARAEAAVQRLVETFADPALAGKEGMAHARQVVERADRQHGPSLNRLRPPWVAFP
jgi:hypothetical protein